MDNLLGRILESNPFSRCAVSEPREALTHVEGIHQRQLEELIRSAGEVWRERGHARHVVWGEAGTGKSHLLARLHHWAQQDNRGCCLYLHSLQANPEGVAACLIERVVHQLGPNRGGVYRHSRLYALVREAIHRSLVDYPPASQPPSVRQAFEAYSRLVDRLVGDNPHVGPDVRSVFAVLFRVYVAAGRRDSDVKDPTIALALRWLSGDSICHHELGDVVRELSEPLDRTIALPKSPTPESVLIALAELAWLCGRPLILCVDQIESLTADQVQELARFLHPLLDHACNLLVVVAGIEEKIRGHLNLGNISPAAWDRLSQNPSGIKLERISPAQARQLVELPLRQFLEPFLADSWVNEQLERDSLFPLGQDWFERRMGGLSEVRARDVLGWARERWHERQTQVRESKDLACLESSRHTNLQPAGKNGPQVLQAHSVACRSETRPALASTTKPSHAAPTPRPQPSTASRKGWRLEILAYSTAVVLLAVNGWVLWSRTEQAAKQAIATATTNARPAARETAAIDRPTGMPETAPSATVREESGARRESNPSKSNEIPFPPSPALPVAATAASSQPVAPPKTSAPTVATAQPGSPVSPPSVAAAPGIGGVANRPESSPRPQRGNPTISARDLAMRQLRMASQQTPTAPSGQAAAQDASPTQPVAQPQAVSVAPANVPSPQKTLPAGGAELSRNSGNAATGRASAATLGSARPAASTPVPSAASAATASGGTAATVAPVAGASSPAAPKAVSISVAANPDIERLLSEAWGLIERGDHDPGRSRLEEARKLDREDLRADFSLGLLDAMIDHDWVAAEKRFSDCVHRAPDSVPSRNNLAVAQLHNKREADAVRQFRAIVEQHAATPEVVQNLGCFRQLVKQGTVRKGNSFVKSVDDLYTDAAVATAKSAQPQMGFRLMALQLADGRTVGWTDARKMTESPAPAAHAASPPGRPMPSNPAAAARPVPVNPMPVDPRLQQLYGPQRPGTNSPVQLPQNMPANPRSNRTRPAG